ncbi:MAG: exodeoxyribonuclease V subunit gamma [Syntrophaceae bacterium]|nr:exodeoxyribonuclease V subunit gamma [Syntrophaceae bacterium]
MYAPETCPRENDLEDLAEKLAEVLSSPLALPLQAEIILMQSKGMERWVSMEVARPKGRDRGALSLNGRLQSARKRFPAFLAFFLLVVSCGGSTDTDGSGASVGTDYGKKTVYDTSWRIAYYVEKDRVYAPSWSLAYHLEGNRLYDTSWRLVARIDGDRVYSEDWSLLYWIDGDRIYDPNWRLVYYVEDR